MAEPMFNVLFLCTGDCGRSILADSIRREIGAPERTSRPRPEVA